MKSEHQEYILRNIDQMSVKEIGRHLHLKEKKIWEFLKYQKGRKKSLDIPSEEIKVPLQKKPAILSIILIIILGVTVYGNSLNGQFIWDDEHLIKDNIYIRNWSHMPQVFTEGIGAGSEMEYHFYRPFQIVTYMVDYSLWKLNVKGYHLTNILLHILVAVGIYCLINVLFNDNLLSLLTGSFYVVHPIHTEVVTYLSGRADSLSLLFILLCILLYLKNSKISSYIFMLLSYALALLSKESSLILPVLLLVYHYSFKERLKVRAFFSIVGLSVVYIIIRLTILKTLLVDVAHTTTLAQRLPGFFTAITSYMQLLFLPLNLHMEYVTANILWGNIKVVLGIVIVFASLICVFMRKKDNPLIFFSVVWFFVALLPVSNIYPINAYMSEHWLYVPSIGFFVVIAQAIILLYRRRGFKIFAIIIAVSSLIFYSYLTIKQNTYWSESINFYKYTLKHAPDSYRVHYNLGVAYKAIGKREEAIHAYKKAIKIKDDYTEAYNDLGTVYYASHKNEEAIAAYKKAIEIEEDYTAAHNNLGNIYYVSHKYDEAIHSYTKAIEIDPDLLEAHYNLGVAYKAVNKNEEAIRSYTKAIEIDPNYAKAHRNLGVAYNAVNRSEEAIASYRKAIAIKPDYAKAHSSLAVVYFQKKQYKSAIEYCDKAKELGFTNLALMEALKSYRESN